MTRDELTALRARVWRRSFDAGAVAELLRETTNEHARRADLTAAERGSEDELLGIANDPAAIPPARGLTRPHAPTEGAI